MAAIGAAVAARGMAPPPLLKIRTITAGITLYRGRAEEWPLQIEQAAEFNAAAKRRYEAEGFEVQTTRIATNSFEDYVDVSDREAALAAFATIDATLER